MCAGNMIKMRSVLFIIGLFLIQTLALDEGVIYLSDDRPIHKYSEDEQVSTLIVSNITSGLTFNAYKDILTFEHNIKHVTFSNVVPLSSFLGYLPDSVVSVSIHNCDLDQIPVNALKNLTRLEELLVSDNHIEEIPKDLLQDLPNLKRLDINYNLVICYPSEEIGDLLQENKMLYELCLMKEEYDYYDEDYSNENNEMVYDSDWHDFVSINSEVETTTNVEDDSSLIIDGSLSEETRNLFSEENWLSEEKLLSDTELNLGNSFSSDGESSSGTEQNLMARSQVVFDSDSVYITISKNVLLALIIVAAIASMLTLTGLLVVLYVLVTKLKLKSRSGPKVGQYSLMRDSVNDIVA